LRPYREGVLQLEVFRPRKYLGGLPRRKWQRCNGRTEKSSPRFISQVLAGTVGAEPTI